jgi:hypothetical protein
MNTAPTGAVPGPRRSVATQVAVLVAVLVVAALVGVSIGGALLAAVGVTFGLVLAVVGLTLWRRRRQTAALVTWAAAVGAGVLAVIGFLDAVS